MIRLAATVLLAALLGCQTTATTLPCPGEAQTPLLTFKGSVDASGGACAFAGPGDVSFSGVITYGTGDAAYLCMTGPDAVPLVGTHDSRDHVIFTGPPAGMGGGVQVDGCACTVVIAEALEGNLHRESVPGGTSVTFHDGRLLDTVTPEDPAAAASCEPPPQSGATSTGPTCGVPCTTLWTGITGTVAPP